jgi:hypothetical protein
VVNRIPNKFHFCFGFAESPEFLFTHYLAVKSAVVTNRPEQATIYFANPAAGPWWERVQRYAELRQVKPRTEIFGHPLDHYAHRADVFRLETLLRAGGIYLDIDTLCLMPFAPLFEHECVMAQQDEGGYGLCNAVVLAEAESAFLRNWLDQYVSFCGHQWDEHAVRLPLRLSRQDKLAGHICVLPHTAFFAVPYQCWRWLMEGEDLSCFVDSYCVHLWETFSMPRLRDHPRICPNWPVGLRPTGPTLP